MREKIKMHYTQARRISDIIFAAALAVLIISRVVKGTVLSTVLMVLAAVICLCGGAVNLIWCVCPECGHVLPRSTKDVCVSCGAKLGKYAPGSDNKGNQE